MIIAPAATATTREALAADREAARAYAVALSQRAQERREMRIQEMRRTEDARAQRRDDDQSSARESSSSRPRGNRLVDILC